MPIRSPANSAQPRICSSGSPRTRCRIMSSRSCWVVAVLSSTSASSSANTHPATRSRVTSASRSGASGSSRSVVLLALSEEPLELGGDFLSTGHPIRPLSLERIVLLLQCRDELLDLGRGRHLLSDVCEIAGRCLLQRFQWHRQARRLVEGT